MSHASLSRQIANCVPIIVCRVYRPPLVNLEFRRRYTPQPSRPVQRRAPHLVPHVKLGSLVNEKIDDLPVSAISC